MNFGAPVKHLLVDLDGTLLGNRNIPLSYQFLKEAFTHLHKYGGWRASTRALLDIRSAFENPNPDQANDARVVERFSRRMNLSPETARQVLKDGVATIFPGLSRHFFPVPGAKDFLEWAKDHLPLTLATNPVWPQKIIELRVKWAGLDPAIFGFITDVTQMHACKPQPEYYREILEKRGLKAEDCILVGDNVKMDLPATRVGIRVFIVGQFKRSSILTISGAKAQAWRGTYQVLRSALGG